MQNFAWRAKAFTGRCCRLVQPQRPEANAFLEVEGDRFGEVDVVNDFAYTEPIQLSHWCTHERHTGHICNKQTTSGVWCDMHTCACGREKNGNQDRCKSCSAAFRCTHERHTGHICNKQTTSGVWCDMHTCACGREKNGNQDRCKSCSAAVRCMHWCHDDQQCAGQATSGAWCAKHTCGCFREKNGNQRLCDTCRGAAAPGDGLGKMKRPRTFMIVMDFDQTITRKHATDRPAPSAPEIELNAVDSHLLREITQWAHREGHALAIASFANNSYVILQYLDVLLGPGRPYLRSGDIETGFPERPMEDGKNGHIARLLGRMPGGAVDVQVVLFDDNATNVRLAQNAGHLAVHCPAGLNREAWRRFTAMKQQFRDM